MVLSGIMVSRKLRPKVLTSQKLATSWRVGFYEDALQFGGNKPVPYARIIVPDFTLVAAVRKSDGTIPLVRQYRHGARREFWELPAGLIEGNERPEDCIKREFQEEVGYELLNPKLITRIFPSPARSAQVAYVFSGKVGRRSRKRPDANEVLNVRFVSKTSALKLLSQNISATHLLAYLLYARPQKQR
jgi:8-oxo-dGTP pyrophosphatase MutT (NUDIX family)